MKLSTLAALVITLLLVACAASKPIVAPEQHMIDTIQTYETGLLSGNQAVFLSMVCQQDVASMQTKFKELTPVVLTISGGYSASGIVFDTEARSDNLVLLKIVSGKGRINSVVGKDSIPLSLPPFNVNNRIVLRNEGGSWKLCFGATAEAVALKPLSTGNNGLTVADIAGLGRIFVFAAAGLILIFSGVRSLGAASRKDRQNRALKANGVLAQAEIVDRSAPYTITYRFAAQDAATIEHKTRIVAKDYSALKVGDHVDVRYDPMTPDLQMIERGATEQDMPQRTRRIGYMVLGTGLLMIATLLFIVVR